MNDCETYKGLLVGLLDDELTTDERREINAHLTRCATCRTEYEELRETQGKLSAVTFREPTDAILEQVWRAPYHRLSKGLAVWMIVAGYLLLLGYGLYEFFRHGDTAVLPALAVASIVLGVLFLFFQLIRERVKTYKTDPYKEIER